MRHIPPAHVEYARLLDRTHGREIAKNYLRAVTDPSYMSPRKLADVKKSEQMRDAAAFCAKVPRPPGGWKKAAIVHITEVGAELITDNPNSSPQQLEKAIAKTYPFGARENQPYKVWREELKRYIEAFASEQITQSLRSSYQPKLRKDA